MSDTPKVLIVDDEQDSIDFVHEALADLDCEVISAMDGQAGLELAQKERPQVIILDVQMPKLGGFEVFGKLKDDDKLASVPVIMLTAVTQRTGMKFDSRDMDQYTGHEPEAYIDKPIEPVILKQTVTRLLKKSAQS